MTKFDWPETDSAPDVRRRLTWRQMVANPGKTVRRSLRALKNAVLPERQIFFRIRSEIDYVTLTPVRQLAIYGGVLAVVGWMAFSTFHVLAFDWMVERRAQSAKDAWSAFARVDSERGELVAQRDRLNRKIQDLEVTLAVVQVSQEKLLERVAARTDEGIAEATRLLGMTGIDVDTLIEAAERREKQDDLTLASAGSISASGFGRGGPFVAASQRAKIAPLQIKAEDLEQRMVQQQRMRDLLKALPLASPVDHYRMTSTFGPRRDPFYKRVSRHRGLDLANKAGTPIFSPGPGEVVFAGWNGLYGRMIEIDHGFGVRTRYGHLEKLLVEKGDKVIFRDEIAKMGSTGRSTGPHLHYEVLVNGVPTDPGKLLKAGKYFFKTDAVVIAAQRAKEAAASERLEPGADGPS